MKDPKLFLVSAPSGAGKSSLIDAEATTADSNSTEASEKASNDFGEQHFGHDVQTSLDSNASNLSLIHI